MLFRSITSGFGFQSNTDNWISLLNVILYNKYGIDLTKIVEVFCLRNEQSDYNICKGEIKYDMLVINAGMFITNSFYFNLIEQQAKNIYLNILESGKIGEYSLVHQ